MKGRWLTVLDCLQSALTSAMTESACELHKNVNCPAISTLVTEALEAVLSLKEPQLVQVLRVIPRSNVPACLSRCCMLASGTAHGLTWASALRGLLHAVSPLPMRLVIIMFSPAYVGS